jgi:hypothetical protein
VKIIHNTGEYWDEAFNVIMPVWYQAGEMYYALCDLSQELSYDSITQYEVELLESLKSFYVVLLYAIIY